MAGDSLFGHTREIEEVEKLLSSSRLHHSWLIEGKKGIGKATLARRVGQFLLAEPSERLGNLAIKETSTVWNLTNAGSHPDFLYIEPAADNKTQTISVDDIRGVSSFFTKSPALSKHRIVIIDAVDNMNINAANALLKILEEPPEHGMLFLVSHCSGIVLATLRSRCYRLKLSRLSNEEVRAGLKSFNPNLSPKEIELATCLAEGSLGKALHFVQQEGKKLHQDFFNIVKTLSTPDQQAIQKFCTTYAADNQNYELLCDLMLYWSHQLSTKTGKIFVAKKGIKLWGELNEIIKTTRRLNMDKKLSAQSMFLALEKLLA